MKEKNSFRVDIQLDDDSFQGDEGRFELADILEALASRVRACTYQGHEGAWRTNYPGLQDSNGNTVGLATTREENPDEAIAAALAVFMLDSITRATLDAIDPAAVGQAVDALNIYGGKRSDFIRRFKAPQVLRAAVEERLIEATESVKIERWGL